MSTFCPKGPVFVISLFLLLLGYVSRGQYGPGGVGDSIENVLWLRADAGTPSTTDTDPIHEWLDQSRNGIDVGQTTANKQPLYRTNILNGYPAIEFDNISAGSANDLFEAPDTPLLDSTNGLTLISVVRMNELNNNARSIVAKRVNVGVNQSYMLFFFSNNHLHADVVSNNNRFSTPNPAFAANTNYILSLWYNGTLAAAQRCRIYSNQSLRVTATETSAAIPDFNSPLIIGATHISDNRPFGGFIAEVIIYRKALNTAERILVDNYLSAKYNIAISANDVYRQDDGANGDFDHQVAGIGRIDASNMSTDGQGYGILRINNANDLNDNEFLVWGHNNGTLEAIETTDVPLGVEARLDRVWRFSELDVPGNAVDVGEVQVIWDLTGLGPVDPNDLRLLIDTDNDGSFSDEIPISGAFNIADNTYAFSAIDGIENGLRMTLGTADVEFTPLPIELLYFNVSRIDSRKAQIDWKVASERDCDYYKVERSVDNASWQNIAQVKGAGTSPSQIKYNVIDSSLSSGVFYYRLRQIDYDGTVHIYPSKMLVGSQDPTKQLQAYPTPACAVMYAMYNSSLGPLIMLDALGNDVTDKLHWIVKTDTYAEIDVAALPIGTYILRQGEQTAKVIHSCP